MCRAFAPIVVAMLLLPASALADTTVSFDDLVPGTVLTTQYANAGGAGQGVTFGPLPGTAGDSARPVVTSAPGQAHSDGQVADINCPTCNEGIGYIPDTTATFAVPRSHVSVDVGLLGTAASACSAGSTAPTCAVVTLVAYDSNGNRIATSSPVTVTQGAGVNTPLSVSTPTASIVGFEVSTRDPTDNEKSVAIDDLTFNTPSAPASPDFTLTPAATTLVVAYGESVTDQITIGRIGGSNGAVALGTGALPSGVHAQFLPNPATATTTLTLTADPTVPPTRGAAPTVTVTGTPLAASAGAVAHSVTLQLQVESACADVVTGQELIDALRSGCRNIMIDDRAQIDLTQLADNPGQYPGYDAVSTSTGVIHVPPGVTLESDRSAHHLGGELFMTHQVLIPGGDMPKSMIVLSAHTRLIGLRLVGYGEDAQHAEVATGVSIIAPDVLVQDNEVSFWPNAGISVGPVSYGRVRHDADAAWIRAQARRVHITENFIHDNVDCNLGYGIVISNSSYALIDRNVFDYNKHDVAGDGTPGSGYVAELNFTLSESFKTCAGDYGGHFDMHGHGPGSNKSHVGGTAGTYLDIRDNTVRGDQRYHFLGRDRRPAFDLRGTPTLSATFADNVTEAPEGKAVVISGTNSLRLALEHKLVVSGNRYSVNTSQQLAVGDFDGDGCSDVFVATGTQWMYSPCGRGAWRFLNASSLRLNRLAFGDFNGDGKTDVFTQSGDHWLVSYGGMSPWRALPATSNIPMSSYRFGDFNGDGKTDVFRANGSRFYYSSAGAGSWRPLASSRLKVSDLRFCDFNGDGKTDVFSLANHQWSVSYGGTTDWHHLNRELSSDLGQLVFGDFDGDGRCDIARAHGRGFQVSWGGTTPWEQMFTRYQRQASFGGTLLGHFTATKRTDVLEFAIDGTALARYELMSDFGTFDDWSQQDML